MRARSVWAMMVFVAIGSARAAAQDPLGERLNAHAAAAVRDLMARATSERLPTAPLRNKALEGASKGADGERIIGAVEHLLDRLRSARAVLGESATTAELVSAAAVLDLGVDARSVGALRRASPTRPLASALVGLAFLVQRGAPVDGSVTLVREMLEARASDADFARFRELVERDVRSGAPIGNAARARARAFTGGGSTTSGVPGGEGR